MMNLLLFSVIVGIVSSIVLLPFSSNEGEQRINKWVLYPFLFVVITIVTFVVYYVFNIDRNSSSLWIYAVILSCLSMFITRGKERVVKGGLFVVMVAIALFMLSAPLFNANKKYEVVEMDQQTEIQPFDESKTPASVPPKFARNKMKKAFGQVPNTSYYELGHLQIQKVGGEFVYIAPVEFSSFFKWWNGKSIPGYFTMSATNAADNPKFVKMDMTYTPSSYFHKNADRHIRMQYPNLIFHGDLQLEVDDEGTPYYIGTYGHFISARNGFKAEGIVAVNAKNGETKRYTLDEVPAFIDSAVAPEAVSLQNSYFGKYVNGFWNSLFGKRDVKIPSDEGTVANVSPIFDEDGHMYYFTDFTSPKEEVDSMLGYALTDGRTGKATYYTGSLEESYMDSEGVLQIIEKKFIEKKWSGEMPVLYNFYNQASWLTPVLDSNGFLQNYFIVSAANPEISVYGNTPNEALKLYKTALQREGSSVEGSSQADEATANVVAKRVYKEVAGDFTNVFVLTEDDENFMLSSEVLPLAIYIEEGDKLALTYLDTGELFLPVKELDNKSMK